MAHSWNCPTSWEAEQEARRNADRDHDYRWGKSYSDPYDCPEANMAYRDEYDYQWRCAEERAEEERASQRRAEERRHEEEMEMEYYRQQAEEDEYNRAFEDEYNRAFEEEYQRHLEEHAPTPEPKP